MLKTTVWLETRDRKGHLQALGSRILLTEDPKVMENYKKLLESGKEPKDSETGDPQKPDSSQPPSETSLARGSRRYRDHRHDRHCGPIKPL